MVTRGLFFLAADVAAAVGLWFFHDSYPIVFTIALLWNVAGFAQGMTSRC